MIGYIFTFFILLVPLDNLIYLKASITLMYDISAPTSPIFELYNVLPEKFNVPIKFLSLS